MLFVNMEPITVKKIVLLEVIWSKDSEESNIDAIMNFFVDNYSSLNDNLVHALKNDIQKCFLPRYKNKWVALGRNKTSFMKSVSVRNWLEKDYQFPRSTTYSSVKAKRTRGSPTTYSVEKENRKRGNPETYSTVKEKRKRGRPSKRFDDCTDRYKRKKGYNFEEYTIQRIERTICKGTSYNAIEC